MKNLLFVFLKFLVIVVTVILSSTKVYPASETNRILEKIRILAPLADNRNYTDDEIVTALADAVVAYLALPSARVIPNYLPVVNPQDEFFLFYTQHVSIQEVWTTVVPLMPMERVGMLTYQAVSWDFATYWKLQANTLLRKPENTVEWRKKAKDAVWSLLELAPYNPSLLDDFHQEIAAEPMARELWKDIIYSIRILGVDRWSFPFFLNILKSSKKIQADLNKTNSAVALSKLEMELEMHGKHSRALVLALLKEFLLTTDFSPPTLNQFKKLYHRHVDLRTAVRTLLSGFEGPGDAKFVAIDPTISIGAQLIDLELENLDDLLTWIHPEFEIGWHCSVKAGTRH